MNNYFIAYEYKNTIHFNQLEFYTSSNKFGTSFFLFREIFSKYFFRINVRTPHKNKNPSKIKIRKKNFQSNPG